MSGSRAGDELPAVAHLIELLRGIGAPASSHDAVTALPWGDAEFSERMLDAAVDESFQMPSGRPYTKAQSIIDAQVAALVEWFGFRPGQAILDVACGRGRLLGAIVWRGAIVTGVDIAPAAIRDARRYGVGTPCTFLESDLRAVELPDAAYDAGIYLHGQAGLLDSEDLELVLRKLRRVLRPGAPLAVELMDREHVPKWTLRSWSAGENAWGLGEHLALSQREWREPEQALVYSQSVFDYATGERAVYQETERLIDASEFGRLLQNAGFPQVKVHAGWDGRLGEYGDRSLLVIGK